MLAHAPDVDRMCLLTHNTAFASLSVRSKLCKVCCLAAGSSKCSPQKHFLCTMLGPDSSYSLFAIHCSTQTQHHVNANNPATAAGHSARSSRCCSDLELPHRHETRQYHALFSPITHATQVSARLPQRLQSSYPECVKTQTHKQDNPGHGSMTSLLTPECLRTQKCTQGNPGHGSMTHSRFPKEEQGVPAAATRPIDPDADHF